MIRYFLVFALTQVAHSGEPTSKLHGSWRSDAVSTTAYLSKHAQLNDYQKKVFTKLFGKSVVTFKPDGTGTMKMEAYSIPKKDGGELDLAATEFEFTFEILGEANSQVAVKTTSDEPLFDDYPFAILKFHDADTYSVSLSDGVTEINGREFFKRVKNADSESGADQPATRSKSETESNGK